MKQTLRRMMLGLPLLVLTVLGMRAEQDPVSYWYHEYGLSEGKFRVTNEGRACTSYKVLDSSTSLSDSKEFGVGSNPKWDNGNYKWVVVKGEVTISRLIVIGEAHLILTNGSRLVCTNGVLLEGSANSLNIYSQSSGDQEGRLEASITESDFKYNAAIGCSKDCESNGSPDGMGKLAIHGGIISATAKRCGAGIGGGEDRGIRPDGSVTIWAGRVTATGGWRAAGIGGGFDAGQGGPVTIYGGTVTVSGGEGAAGIGNARNAYGGGNGGVVTIYGGDITVNPGEGGAGIGGGYCGNETFGHGGTFTMHDGTLKIHSTEKAAAIGGSIKKFGSEVILHGGGTINISGGTITTTGGGGLGGMDSDIRISGGTLDLTAGYGPAINVGGGSLNITGGSITARGAEGCAGIATYFTPQIYNETKKRCIMNFSNATIHAIGGKDAPGIGGCSGVHCPATLNIYSGEVTAESGENTPGIGGGHRRTASQDIGATVRGLDGPIEGGGYGIDVVISGGTVISKGDGDSYAMGPQIASNWRWYNCMGTVNISDNLKVGYGATIDGNFTTVYAGERNSTCNNRKCVKIEACEHDGFGYCYENESHHNKRCNYCGHEEQEAHSYGTGGRCACGKEGQAEPETWTVTVYEAASNKAAAYGEGTSYKVVKGEKFVIPQNTDISGLTFMGWLQTTAETQPADCEMRDEELYPVSGPGLTDGGQELTPSADVTLYARYRCQYDTNWTWEETSDGMTAKVTVTWLNGDATITDLAASYVDVRREEPTAEAEGSYNRYATATYTKPNGVVYQFTDQFVYPISYSLTISDNADNSEAIAGSLYKSVKTVTLSGRTLYKDGSWNTLCLPFDVTTQSGPLSGDGVVAQVIDSEASQLNDDNGHLSLSFKAAPAVISAGIPFIIKWNASGEDIVNPQFEDVTVTVHQPASVNFPGGAFVGEFSPFAITADNLNDIILLTANNTLGYSQSARTLHSCRAHFEVHRTGSESPAMTSFDLRFADDAVTTIDAVANATLNTWHSTLGTWYTINGRRLQAKPAQKGLYIHQGRKVVIR